MTWLIQWGIPLVIVCVIVAVAGVVADVWANPLTMRRWHYPTIGDGQMYLREKWEPREYDREWGKRLRGEIRKG